MMRANFDPFLPAVKPKLSLFEVSESLANVRRFRHFNGWRAAPLKAGPHKVRKALEQSWTF
jgi:hypothetical protein